MNKTYLIATAISVVGLFFSIAAKAQFSIYAGYQQARYTDNGTVDNKPFNGIRLDLSYTWMFSKYVGAGLGVGYSFDTRANAELEFPGDVKANFSTQEQYVYVPLRLHFKMPLYKAISLDIFAGPSLSYATSGSDTFDFTDGLENPLSFTYDMYANKIESDNLPPHILDILNSRLGDARYERLGCDMTAGAGLQLAKNFKIEGSVSWFLTNQLKEGVRDGSLHRRLWSTGVAFTF